MNADEAGRERQGDDSAGQKLPGSDAAGPAGSIPRTEDGVGIGAGAEANTFEPEEDPGATDDEKS
jgi:hypothetical protein